MEKPALRLRDGEPDEEDETERLDRYHAEMMRLYRQVRKWEVLYHEAYIAARTERTLLTDMLDDVENAIAQHAMSDCKKKGWPVH